VVAACFRPAVQEREQFLSQFRARCHVQPWGCPGGPPAQPRPEGRSTRPCCCSDRPVVDRGGLDGDPGRLSLRAGEVRERRTGDLAAAVTTSVARPEPHRRSGATNGHIPRDTSGIRSPARALRPRRPLPLSKSVQPTMLSATA